MQMVAAKLKRLAGTRWTWKVAVICGNCIGSVGKDKWDIIPHAKYGISRGFGGEPSSLSHRRVWPRQWFNDEEEMRRGVAMRSVNANVFFSTAAMQLQDSSKRLLLQLRSDRWRAMIFWNWSEWSAAGALLMNIQWSQLIYTTRADLLVTDMTWDEKNSLKEYPHQILKVASEIVS